MCDKLQCYILFFFMIPVVSHAMNQCLFDCQMDWDVCVSGSFDLSDFSNKLISPLFQRAWSLQALTEHILGKTMVKHRYCIQFANYTATQIQKLYILLLSQVKDESIRLSNWENVPLTHQQQVTKNKIYAVANYLSFCFMLMFFPLFCFCVLRHVVLCSELCCL